MLLAMLGAVVVVLIGIRRYARAIACQFQPAAMRDATERALTRGVGDVMLPRVRRRDPLRSVACHRLARRALTGLSTLLVACSRTELLLPGASNALGTSSADGGGPSARRQFRVFSNNTEKSDCPSTSRRPPDDPEGPG
jgi:hypothetical protein